MDPITWAIIIGSALAGVAVGYFWDEIKEWASRMLGHILDAINTAIEITSDATVYLVKQGSRFYKRIEVYVRNVRSNATTLKYKEEEIAEVPADVEEQFRKKGNRVKVLQEAT
ncbi:hypothetical protein GNF10_30565 [Nostoc sp. UCD121]|uniref:hypothetical protein n=1 Tax=unclassified Nostoc TaxID=2593658 RepID=UPI0016296DBC|nr:MULTISPECIES: hypothetical protein [unclassified Nostoc]MBC1218737.1 hypothetical protein [Nostoc sp. UCD120]MBC1280175.1 hypothetical protein [Nostoc sp. UCD121]MBC1297692.1 hypothetical protein [Nostoc sp. UCD122]